MNDEADGDEVIAVVVENRSAAGPIVERPAERVLNQTRPVLGGRDLPELFEADAVLLRLVAFGKFEMPDEPLRERPSRSFRDEGVLGAQFHTANEIAFRLTVAADAHSAVGNAANGATLVIKPFACSNAVVDFDAKLCGLLAEPFAELAEADDVIAVVLHQRRHRPVRQS